MKKRIREKKLKQYCREHLREECWCGRETEPKEKLIIIDEFLGKIVLHFPYAKCVTRHEIDFYPEFYLDDKGWEKFNKQRRKAMKRLLLKNYHPQKHEYYTLDEVAKLTGMSPKEIIENSYDKYPDFYSLKYKGKWICLKESVDKYINRTVWWGHGTFKLVNYKTEEDNWIKRVLIHENYDIDVEFYDGTFRRTNVLEYLQSLPENDLLRKIIIEEDGLMDEPYINTDGICYDNEDAMFEKEMLYKGKIIPPFEGGLKRNEYTPGCWRFIFD